MPEIKILKCDLCYYEERSDGKRHWTEASGGPVKIDLSNVPGSQYKLGFEILCTPCAKEISSSVIAALAKRRKHES